MTRVADFGRENARGHVELGRKCKRVMGEPGPNRGGARLPHRAAELGRESGGGAGAGLVRWMRTRFATLGDFAASNLPEGQDYRLAVVAEGLKFDPLTPVATASGGERRRAALAKLLAEAPELMLLD